MSGTPASVIIVSQGRPAHLRRCVQGVWQSHHRPFEVVVVADQAGLDAIADLPFHDRLKTMLETGANISVARNAGLTLAAGEVVAFIDDDAVPEPTWLGRLLAAFDDAPVMAAGGHVIGRNGFSLQWGSRAVDGSADEVAVPVQGNAPQRPDLPDGYALKLQGTNFALRRGAVDQLGGFDTAFAFYLDDTDFAYRLHRAGLHVVTVPGALVHHGFAASTRRRANRAPRSLGHIGASMAVYLQKHADADTIPDVLAALRAAQRRRLGRFLLAGDLEPRDLRRLMAELDAGIAAGMARPSDEPRLTLAEKDTFMPVRDDAPKPSAYLSGRWFQSGRCLRDAARLAADGCTVTAILLEPTVRAHRMRFSDTGVWVQEGGLFGPSDRAQPRARWWRFPARIAAEMARLRGVRELS